MSLNVGAVSFVPTRACSVEEQNLEVNECNEAWYYNQGEVVDNSITEILKNLEKDVTSFDAYGSKGYIAYKTPGIESKKRIVIVVPEMHYLFTDDQTVANCARAEIGLLSLLIEKEGVKNFYSESSSDMKIEEKKAELKKYRGSINSLLDNFKMWGDVAPIALLKNIYGSGIEAAGAGDPGLASRMDAAMILAYFYIPSSRSDNYIKQSIGNIMMEEEALKKASGQIKALCGEWGIPCEERKVQLTISQPYPQKVVRSFFAPADGINDEQKSKVRVGITEELSANTDKRTGAIAGNLHKTIKENEPGVIIVGAEHANVNQYLEKLGFGVVVISHTGLRERLKKHPSLNFPDFLR